MTTAPERDLMQAIAREHPSGLERWLMSPEERRMVRRLVQRGLVLQGRADTKQKQCGYWLSPEGEEELDR